MKILVTGGSGFIGVNLVGDLLRQGHTVCNLDPAAPLAAAQRPCWQTSDILDQALLRSQFEKFEPTHVVHLAARTDTPEGETLERYTQNTDGTRNVLAAVAATPSVQRLIVTSTQFVCGPGYVPKHDEDYAPHTVYGQSKIITEQLTRQAELHCAWTIIRPTTIWGPWLLRHREQFFRTLRRGLYFHPGGRPCIRSWGYVGNVVYQIRKIFEAPADAVHRQTYYVGDPPRDLYDWANCCSMQMLGRPARRVPRSVMWLMALAGEVAHRAGLKSPLKLSRYQSMTEDYISPVDKTLALCGPMPYTLEQGVAETLGWLHDYEASLAAPAGSDGPEANRALRQGVAP